MNLLSSCLLLLILAASARAQDPEILWMHGGHVDQTSAAAFSPDARTLVSAGLDGYLKVWEPVSGRLLRTLEAGSVQSISFSREGDLLATGGTDGTIRLWDMSGYRVIRTFVGESAVNGVAISPDGSFIAAGYSAGDVRIWDLASGGLRHTLAAHTYSVNSVAISPDSRLVASGSDDFTAIIWKAADGTISRRITGPMFAVTAVAFSPDGKRLALTAKTIVGEYTLADSTVKLIHSHVLTITSIAYSADGRYLASVSEDSDVPGFILGNTVVVTDLRGIKPAFGFKQEFAVGYGTAVTFSSDGRYMAWGASSGTIRIRTLAAESAPTIFTGDHRTITDHYKEVAAAAFSPVGGILASGSGEGTINLWQAGTGILLRRLLGHNLGVNGLDFTTDGRSLASAGTDGSVRIWNVASGAMQNIVYVSAEWAVSAVAFSPDGRRLVAGTGFGDSTLAIWDTSRFDPIITFHGHSGPITGVAFGGDGRQVISASRDGSVRVWNASTGALDLVLAQSATPWLSLALSEDGRTLAAGNHDGSIRLWAMPSGDPLAELDGHDDRVDALSLSADGSLLVSGGADGTVRIWEVASREERHRYIGYPYPQMSVAINAESGWVASGTADASIIVWKLLTTATIASEKRFDDAARISAAPNPFSDRIRFEFDLAHDGTVDGAIFDMRGERVATIARGYFPAGRHGIDWEIGSHDDGIYLYRIIVGGRIMSGTIIHR